MIKKLFILVMAALMLAAPALAVNTITATRNTITISSIDSDWDIATTWSWASAGVYLHSIIFLPGAADDKLLITDTNDSGATLFPAVKCADEYDAKVLYYNNYHRPYLDYSGSTLSAGSVVIINIGKVPE